MHMTVEEAVQVAIERVKTLFQGTLHRLEEVRVDSDGEFDVTISYRSADGSHGVTQLGSYSLGKSIYERPRAAIGIDVSRTYKDVIISKDGQVKAVQMRQIVLG